MPLSIDTLIHCKTIIPVVPTGKYLPNHSVAITQGQIVDILPTPKAEKTYQAKQIHHLKQHALIPGFINAHTHIPMNLFRGLADDLMLMDWLKNHIWAAEADVLNEQSAAIGAQLAISEMLLSGTTCFCDMYFFTEALIKAVDECKIRAQLSLHVMNIPNLWAKSSQECLDKSESILSDIPKHELIGLTIAPQSPYTNDDHSLQKCREMANKYNLPLVTHLHETANEIEASMQKYKKRPLKRLDDLGFLSKDVLAIHMVHANDEDLDIISKHNMHVAHCPASNLKLASGFSPVAQMLNRNINVALGCDSVASNNTLDMLSEMRLASLIHKGYNHDPKALCASEVLAMATINGAKAIGLGDQIGSIEKGKKADLCAIDLSDLSTQPCYNPISSIVYAAGRHQVSHVWVNGELRVNEHKLCDINYQTLLEKAQPFIDQARKFQHPKQ